MEFGLITPRPFAHRFRPALLFVVLSAIASSLILVTIVLSFFESSKSSDYHSQFVAVEESLIKYFHTNQSLVEAYRAFAAASHNVTENEFRLFSEKITQGMEQLRVVGVVRQVTDLQRRQFEERQRKLGRSRPEITRGRNRTVAGHDSDYYPIVMSYDLRPGKSGADNVGWDMKQAFEESHINFNSDKLQASIPYFNEEGDITYMLVASISNLDRQPGKHFILISLSPLDLLKKLPLGAGFKMTLTENTDSSSDRAGAPRVWHYEGPAIQGQYAVPLVGIWAEDISLRLGGQDFDLQVERPYTANWQELLFLSALILANLIIHALAYGLQQSRFLRVRADAANEAKSQFLAMMSHEIRTPLNGVMGMADVLRQTRLSHTQQQYLDVIINSSKSLQSVINDVLDSSKIEAGKLQLESIEFDFHELIAELSCLYSGARQDELQQFVASIAPGTPAFLYGDPVRLRQVLMNLLSNAFKFTERGLISLRVESEVEKKSCHLVIKVMDEGIGIGEEQLQKLFESFYQADSDTFRKYGGSGLGLSICKRLVTMMGGSIEVSSKLGAGSCFAVNLTLPLSERPLPRRVDFVGSQLLLVDSLAASASTLREQAHELGLIVRSVDSVEEACEFIARGRAQQFEFIVVIPAMGEQLVSPLAKAIEENSAQLRAHAALLTDVLEFHSRDSRDYAVFDMIGRIPVSVEQLSTTLVRTMAGKSRIESLQEGTAHTEAEQATRSLNVLVVEDNAVNVKVVTAMLSKLGHSFQVAENGFKAIDCFTDHHSDIDTILMDCEMPELDGFATAERIRTFERREGITPRAIVALTAHVLPGMRQRCTSAGMDYFLAKPLSIQQLSEVLERVYSDYLS